jgi:hypothetical protein
MDNVAADQLINGKVNLVGLPLGFPADATKKDLEKMNALDRLRAQLYDIVTSSDNKVAAQYNHSGVISVQDIRSQQRSSVTTGVMRPTVGYFVVAGVLWWGFINLMLGGGAFPAEGKADRRIENTGHPMAPDMPPPVPQPPREYNLPEYQYAFAAE